MWTIAVQPDNQELSSGRWQSFSARWAERAREEGHEVRLVDAYAPTFFQELAGCDAFMWWFAHLPRPRNFAKRLLPAIEHGLGIPVFPTWRTSWHFDDKIAQQYLLDALGVPTPKTWIFWRAKHARAFARSARYPLVLKLTTGIVSENVRLVTSAAEAEYWIARLFRHGVTSLDWPRPSRPRRILARAAAAGRLLLRGRPPVAGTARSDVQRNYLLVQEFLPGNSFDLRVVIIGNRAFAFRRFNRPNDFRASGSGLRDSDPSQIDLASVRLAYQVAYRLGTQSLAVDVLRRGEGGERVLSEISYYYEGWTLHEECPGHWVLNGSPDSGTLDWVDQRMRADDAIWDDFLAGLSAPRASGALLPPTPAPAAT